MLRWGQGGDRGGGWRSLHSGALGSERAGRSPKGGLALPPRGVSSQVPFVQGPDPAPAAFRGKRSKPQREDGQGAWLCSLRTCSPGDQQTPSWGHSPLEGLIRGNISQLPPAPPALCVALWPQTPMGTRHSPSPFCPGAATFAHTPPLPAAPGPRRPQGTLTAGGSGLPPQRLLLELRSGRMASREIL